MIHVILLGEVVSEVEILWGICRTPKFISVITPMVYKFYLRKFKSKNDILDEYILTNSFPWTYLETVILPSWLRIVYNFEA